MVSRGALVKGQESANCPFESSVSGLLTAQDLEVVEGEVAALSHHQAKAKLVTVGDCVVSKESSQQKGCVVLAAGGRAYHSSEQHSTVNKE